MAAPLRNCPAASSAPVADGAPRIMPRDRDRSPAASARFARCRWILIVASLLATPIAGHAQAPGDGPASTPDAVDGTAPSASADGRKTSAVGGGALALELVATDARKGGCRLSFAVRNGMEREIEEFSVEMAVFDTAGGLERLVLLRFGLLLDGKTRVRQFDLDGSSCETIGSVVVNDVASCTGNGLTSLECLRALETASKVATGFGL